MTEMLYQNEVILIIAMYHYYCNQGFVNRLFIVIILSNCNFLKGVLLISFFYGSEVAKQSAVGEQHSWYSNYYGEVPT